MIADLVRPAGDGLELTAGGQTTADGAPRAGIGNLRGPLDTTGFLPLAHLLSDLGSSGDLRLTIDAWQATVCFDNGRMVAAQAEDESGWAALEVVLLGLSGGRFEFTAGSPSLRPNLLTEPHLLWARLEFLATTTRALALYVPVPASIPTLSSPVEDSQPGPLSIRRSSLMLLMGIDGRTDVRSMAQRWGTLLTLKGLAELRSLRLITFEAPIADQVLAPAWAARGVRLPWLSLRAARRLRRRWGRRAIALGMLGAVALSVPATVQGVVVNGFSMLPALRPGQFLVVFRPAYAFSAPQRGDIVVFRNPDLGGDNYVKRVIGVPGDRVQIDAGQVMVNGVALDEPYVSRTDDYSFPSNGQPVRVPRGSYFVLGDNRPVSADSHLGWFVRSDQVVGQAWALPISVGSQH